MAFAEDELKPFRANCLMRVDKNLVGLLFCLYKRLV